LEVARKIIEENITLNNRILSEYDSKKILDVYGIPIVKENLVDSIGEAKGIAGQKIRYPLVLKVNAPGLIHKTELKLVRVGIRNAEELERAYEILEEKSKLHVSKGKILIQEMIESPREFVLGYINDESFG
jgi:acyl-CoA synthetase (NDP forming)